ncbi:Nitrogen fixation protein FixI [Sinorhizobium fredii USDA 205]|uniref:Cadmium-translocating P-type ATPase n=1 Tax=Rhizobium fredii TaxID=380 RepID=A0A844AR51_RHIFR|nr:heavy metal translocating P-type ATPase [Sinorhizobium fredii]AWM26135.1 Type cbb3 cytochrome oxidase biogenesis protein CcoI [Sinorhizobium fredii CCBAU 25509]KSV81687.1 Nitrogen fixation protein FixI [Sinorhizobium fredii USDA 205]MQW98972.1 cadmium-translocating P-type ATPase [Sinorhizobium fredii]MQX13098.1 cadmium-translocating P-type ATPase [Sinorhizobium fredii]UTY50227.1 cadmium-translocating P-type ATPase [Sinorhizobium fredii]
MSCCSGIAVPLAGASSSRTASAKEIGLASRDLGDGLCQVLLALPDVHCAACIAAVETALRKIPGVELARVNLSTKRVTITWRATDGGCPDFAGALAEVGYAAHPTSFEDESRDPLLASLLKALAVAGFSAMNIMILSVSVWSGADPATRHAFHLVSAALALPAVAYSGRIFYRSAWKALSRGRANMDVPISVGVLLAFALSVYDTVQNAPYVYFDASTSLLFILLAGRTLDHLMRGKARSAAGALAKLAPQGANIILPGGAIDYVPLADVRPGMHLIVAAGERVPVDGVVVNGISKVDCSLVTGESRWKHAEVGTAIRSGVLNLANPLTLAATASADGSFLAEMTRMMEAAESGRSTYRRIADRAAALYAPVVHGVALISLFGGFHATGDLHQAVTIAVAVLIITCPCALGLAVPMVQVVAVRRLFERGIMVRDGSAFERLNEVDTVLFDKTGTLTLGEVRLVDSGNIPPDILCVAAAIAKYSKHPASVAIVAASPDGAQFCGTFDEVEEFHGCGIEARAGDTVYRLGRPSWVSAPPPRKEEGRSSSVLSRNGEAIAMFSFEDALRPGARELVDFMQAAGLSVGIVSGDNRAAVSSVARQLAIEDFSAELLPSEKVDVIRALSGAGRKVLMIGDGLNDAPALAAAHVSIAPSSATDIGRSASDFVFLGHNLLAVKEIVRTGSRADALIRQNFGLAIAYNIVSVPFAIAGQVTPLAAAIAMSLSSIAVVANALRLGAGMGGVRADIRVKEPARVRG